MSLPHWEFAWFYPSIIGHREFSMLWGPWNTSLPHRTSFFNNHFYTVQGKSQPHTAQDAISRETPRSRRSLLGLLSHDTQLSKFFSEDSWLQSGKEHGHPTCEINGECRSRGRAVTTPVQCHSVCDKISVWGFLGLCLGRERDIPGKTSNTPGFEAYHTPRIFRHWENTRFILVNRYLKTAQTYLGEEFRKYIVWLPRELMWLETYMCVRL